MTPTDLNSQTDGSPALIAGVPLPGNGSASVGTNGTEPEEIVISPASGWQALALHELWRCRDLLYFLTWRNIKIRYKQTVLGAAWAVLQPLLMMLVFSWAFGEEPLFLFAGVLPWVFFQTAVTGAANSVVSSEGLVSKVYFPRLSIPLAAVGAALVDFAVAFVLLLGLMLWYGRMPEWSVLLLPIALLLIVCAALGIGTLIAALNVAYRDFRYVVTFLVQLWMFATPSIYSDLNRPDGLFTAHPSTVAQASPRESDASADHRNSSTAGVGRMLLVYANPMTSVIDFFRGTLLGTPIPWGRTAFSAILVLVLLAVGVFYFRRVEDSFADVI